MAEDGGWGRMQGVRPSKPYQQWLAAGRSPAEAASLMQEKYGISGDKAALLQLAGQYTQQVLANLDTRAISLYVGIPFCPTRCLYCSFPAFALSEQGQMRGRVVDAMQQEVVAFGNLLRQQGRIVDTVYLGGGTPTALQPAELDRLLTSLERELPTGWNELTVEAGRPETLTSEQLAVLSDHGVQRVCINPETGCERTLHQIGRAHTIADVESAYQRSRSLFPIVNMDLILGLPGERLANVQASLRWVIEMRPENITLHMFSPKRASRFSAEREQWATQLPTAAEAQEMTAWCYPVLLAAGYRPYYLYRQRNILGGQENIGWALPGTECRYNVLMIEEQQDILGIGVGASSKFICSGNRMENYHHPRDIAVYLQRLEQSIAEQLALLQSDCLVGGRVD